MTMLGITVAACVIGSMTSAVATASSGPSMVRHRTRDVKVVRYIESSLYDYLPCTKTLSRLPTLRTYWRAAALDAAAQLCFLLASSANPKPPTSFTSDQWREFVAADEYRTLVHLPSFGYDCDAAGRIVRYDDPGIGFEQDPGWTSIQQLTNGLISFGEIIGLLSKSGLLPVGTELRKALPRFLRAEPYNAAANGFRALLQPNASRPTVRLSDDHKVLTVQHLVASRLSNDTLTRPFQIGPRGLNFLISGYDAPFIWTLTEVHASCVGSSFSMRASSVPSTSVYVDNRLHANLFQGRDLAPFFKAGGETLGASGVGPLYDDCHGDMEPGWGRSAWPTLPDGCREYIPGFTRPSLDVVQPAPPAAYLGVAYEHQLAVRGGVAPYRWTLATGALPHGLTLRQDGVIGGVPDRLARATGVSFAVHDSARHTIHLTTQFETRRTTFYINTALPDATIGEAYDIVAEVAEGGTAPFTWSATGLPDGLTINSNGRISGVPTREQTADVTLTVRDASGASAALDQTMQVLPPRPPDPGVTPVPLTKIGAGRYPSLSANGRFVTWIGGDWDRGNTVLRFDTTSGSTLDLMALFRRSAPMIVSAAPISRDGSIVAWVEHDCITATTVVGNIASGRVVEVGHTPDLCSESGPLRIFHVDMTDDGAEVLFTGTPPGTPAIAEGGADAYVYSTRDTSYEREPDGWWLMSGDGHLLLRRWPTLNTADVTVFDRSTKTITMRDGCGMTTVSAATPDGSVFAGTCYDGVDVTRGYVNASGTYSLLHLNEYPHAIDATGTTVATSEVVCTDVACERLTRVRAADRVWSLPASVELSLDETGHAVATANDAGVFIGQV